MKYILIIIISLLSLISEEIIAAEADFSVFSQVKEIAEQGSFRQERRLKIIKKPFVSEGVFSIQNNEFIWHTKTPLEAIYRITDTTIEETVDGISKFKKLDENPQMASFFKVFSSLIQLDKEALESNFELLTKGTISNWHLELTPIKEPIDKVFKLITVQGSEQVKSIQTETLSGDINLIELSYD